MNAVIIDRRRSLRLIVVHKIAAICSTLVDLLSYLLVLLIDVERILREIHRLLRFKLLQ